MCLLFCAVLPVVSFPKERIQMMLLYKLHLLCFSAGNLQAAEATQKGLAFVPCPVLHSNLIQKPTAELGHLSSEPREQHQNRNIFIDNRSCIQLEKDDERKRYCIYKSK